MDNAFITKPLSSSSKQTFGRAKNKDMIIEAVFDDDNNLDYEDQFHFSVWRQLPDNRYSQCLRIQGLNAFFGWLASLTLHFYQKERETKNKAWFSNLSIRFNSLQGSSKLNKNVIDELVALFEKYHYVVADKKKRGASEPDTVSLGNVAKKIKLYYSEQYLSLDSFINTDGVLWDRIGELSADSDNFYEDLLSRAEHEASTCRSQQPQSAAGHFFAAISLGRFEDALRFLREFGLPTFSHNGKNFANFIQTREFTKLTQEVSRKIGSKGSTAEDKSLIIGAMGMLKAMGVDHSATLIEMLASEANDPKNASEVWTDIVPELLASIDRYNDSDIPNPYTKFFSLLIPCCYPEMFRAVSRVDKGEFYQLQSRTVKGFITNLNTQIEKYLYLIKDEDDVKFVSISSEYPPENYATKSAVFHHVLDLLGCPSLPAEDVMHPIASSLRTLSKSKMMPVDMCSAAQDILNNTRPEEAIKYVHDEKMLDALLTIYPETNPMTLMKNDIPDFIRVLLLQKLK